MTDQAEDCLLGAQASKSHHSMTLEIFKRMPTDVEVKVGSKMFECHKWILSSWSAYFR